MPTLSINLTVTLDTPASIGAGPSRGGLADKTITRNGSGQPIIPGSHVRGKLRHACELILRAQSVTICNGPHPEMMCVPESNTCLLCLLFGSPSHPSRLKFHDLTMEDIPVPDETVRQMVSINRARRVAEPGRLFLIETTPNVKGTQFRNEQAICGYIEQTAHVELLLSGLKILNAWGGGTSRGLGWGTTLAAATLDGAVVEITRAGLESLQRTEVQTP